MKKKYSIIALLIGALFSTSINANIDFSKDEAKYQKMCRKRSSYRANKSTCEAFEKYLKNQSAASDKAALSIKDQIKNTKDDISSLIDLIKKNGILIEKKKTEITKTKENIEATQKEITDLEKEIIDRLALMQEMSGENFVIDFLMSSTSLEDFLVKMDGVNAINESNNDVVKDLNYAKIDLTKKQAQLTNEKKKLDESTKEQNVMLKDYQSKEAELFIKLEEEHKKNSVYNSKLNNLNLNDLDASVGVSKGWINPVSHATVTAVAWYYPSDFGGGWHPGIDLANNTGTPIKAPANGVVLATGFGMGYGNYMLTAHQMGNDTYTFIYGHMSRPGWGSQIKQGQQIGSMGSTGNSTGPHLHFEVFKHSNKSLKSVINKYKANGDLYFGLGYSGVGSCGSVCRIQPQKFLGVSQGQVY